ncbi:group II intron reverse transcriptase/maturase [Evansella cellulosilytica]|uniref:RNA-directed DNA polymerase (Reverse transcriptase) n=1 Tax=Evansella cellulosilytica (strain ATCC 21833 / DSM 2522 / FERM P-1141 / JCM 9156 / N-4) TaxID=649639 RepID=E6TTI7_EVAC2|nr:group II intron reverse transcriptase/maturase [Evansella cellulosilytica]ADU29623.1 RNA-directed DNA polymerase (Reverse transcriptase) [Evansella cellulosilytica DSM 2522]
MSERLNKKSFRDGVKSTQKRKWYSLMDKVWAMSNMEEAFKEVKRNRGSAGVDGVSIRTFEHGVEDNVQVLQRELKEKAYRPRPVKRVFIPKTDGTKRPLGIPTVRDRVVQAAVRRIIEPIFEDKFLDCSFGFRPNKSAHMALEKIRKDLMDGYVYVIDADLKAYFDTIPQDKLIQAVREEVVDGSVIRLIQSFLQAGVMDGGSFHLTEKGTPQGGVISPLLANIYLHPLDELMTKRGHRITRYADDFVICCKSQKGAERVLKSVTRFLNEELGLTVHPEKTKVVNNLEEPFLFLGHEFKGGYYVSASPKALKKFKEKVKEITRRNQTVNIETLIKEKLNPYLRGWGNYFGHFYGKTIFTIFDGWIRRRLRSVQLRSWRNIRKLHRELRKRKWKGDLPRLRMNRWRSSLSTPVHTALPKEWFVEIGLVSLVKLYNDHHPQRG